MLDEGRSTGPTSIDDGSDMLMPRHSLYDHACREAAPVMHRQREAQAKETFLQRSARVWRESELTPEQRRYVVIAGVGAVLATTAMSVYLLFGSDSVYRINRDRVQPDPGFRNVPTVRLPEEPEVPKPIEFPPHMSTVSPMQAIVVD